MQRYKDQWGNHDVVVYAAGDEAVHRELAKEFGVVWCEAPNTPLGAKLNVASTAIARDGCDYLINVGSDDILSPAMAEMYLKMMEAGVRYAGLYNLDIVNPFWCQAMRCWNNRRAERRYEPMGPGRLVRGDVLNDLKGMLWFPTRGKGLDWSMTQQLQFRSTDCSAPVMFGCDGDRWLADIKTWVNMWDYKHIQDYGVASTIPFATYTKLPDAERDLLYLIGQGLT